MSKILESLAGSHVTVFTTGVNQIPTVEGPIKHSMVYDGLLLDEDDDFIYLGQSIEHISNIVAKKYIVTIIDSELVLSTEALDSEAPDPSEFN
jgi:hypothetical protein